MEKIALAIVALLAFLLPLGAYFLVLAMINRRSRPVLVSGLWDAVGLLFASSGFFLVCVPMLLTEFYDRTMGLALHESMLSVWLRHWLVWLAYFLLLASGGAFVLLARSRKTLVYNIDTDRFHLGLESALAALGLAGTPERGVLVLASAPPVALSGGDGTGITEHPTATSRSRTDPGKAELRVETFPSMCHVTLHWENHAPEMRREVEAELEKALTLAAPEDNPAAGWFLSVSGVIFGALFMVVGMILVIVFAPRS